HHASVRSADPCWNRLIVAFAAEANIKLLVGDGFAEPRENVIKRRQVHVGAAHHCTQGLLGHYLAPGDSWRGLYKTPVGEPYKPSICQVSRFAISPHKGSAGSFPGLPLTLLLTMSTSSVSHKCRNNITLTKDESMTDKGAGNSCLFFILSA